MDGLNLAVDVAQTVAIAYLFWRADHLPSHPRYARAQHKHTSEDEFNKRLLPMERALGEAEPISDDPTPAHLLRHKHRFERKDEDGVRTCACGDRYLDAVKV